MTRFSLQLWHVPRYGKNRLQQTRRWHPARDDADFRGGHHWRRLVQMLQKGHYQLFGVRNLKISFDNVNYRFRRVVRKVWTTSSIVLPDSACSKLQKSFKREKVFKESFKTSTVKGKANAWKTNRRTMITRIQSYRLARCITRSTNAGFSSASGKLPFARPCRRWWTKVNRVRGNFRPVNRDRWFCSQICSKLWCIVDGTCTTMLHPAAPGTHCGKHMVRILDA